MTEESTKFDGSIRIHRYPIPRRPWTATFGTSASPPTT